MIDLFKIISILGLLFIISGVLVKKRETRDVLYIFGGIFLEIYSIYLNDLIFVILQMVFTIAAVYDLIKIKKK